MTTNPVGFKFMILMVCLVTQVVYGEEEVRCIEREREALLLFKAAIVDRYGMLSSWTTPNCCQWEGIRCSNLTGHILMLDLHGENDLEYVFRRYEQFSPRYMSGEIHKSLMELRQLEYLNLSSNYFPESHIPEFLASLTNLKYLDLSSCSFGGKIPTQFGSLSHLKHLNLARNYYLEGSIPHQLGNLSQLQHLDLSGSTFEGNVPSQLGNLSKLQELSLGGYYGTLKISDGGQWLSNLISLTHLSLEYVSNLNRSHTWLQVISKLTKLRELSLVNCSLSDHFILSSRTSYFNFSTSLSILDLSLNTFTSPMVFQWVSNITSNLVELKLYGNLLEGSTSSHFGMIMKSLRHLDLSSNYFKANDLKSFMNICTLQSLNMARNNLTEDLPSILGNLSNDCARNSLQELNLKENYIIGTFPDVLVFSSLKTLLLDSNHLSGKIPQDIILPSQLESLSIQWNFFEGGIPKSFGNACTLSLLDISHNRLSEEFALIIHHLSGCVRNSLRQLSLSANKINGSLPDLSIFSTLQVLDLSNNQLNGKIPEGSKLPSTLESFSILSNTLQGGVPKSFGNACYLHSFDMANNSFSDELPIIIDHLSGCTRYSLKELDVGMNQINGTLPDFSIFSSLKKLYLDENMLNGDIPKDIQFPPQLEILDMQLNSLKGVLSDNHFANMSKLNSLELCYNYSLTLAFTQNWVPSFQLHTISLRSCNLGPTFPKWLQTQNEIDYIDISNATISNIVPKWFWAKLASQEMNTINISYNNLQGIIPTFPTKYPSYTVSLRSNQFEGPLPLFLRNSGLLDLSQNKFSDSLSLLCVKDTVQDLYQLDLSNNQLFGHIPDCWNHLNSLAYIDLSYNNLSGKIPTSIGSLLDLEALLLRNNNLLEGIPFSLRNCTKLVMLDISENKLSGPISDWIGAQKELQILSLGRNQFYGSLPLKICGLTNIQLLDLSLNNLSGKIPKCIIKFASMAQTTSSIDFGSHSYFFNTSVFSTNKSYSLNAFLIWKGSKQMFKNKGLSLLKSIDLSSNYFSGEIPNEIEKLSGLISLNLSRNNFIGKIPSNIGKLASLESLDLSRNQLVGSIPPSLTQIYGLGMLDLSHNYLTGEIPTSTQLQSFHTSSYDDNLDLCGPPLKKLCIDGEPTQKPNVEVYEKEYSFFNNDFYISFIFGFVLSFSIVFGSILFKRSWRHTYFRFFNNLADNIYVKVAVFAKVLQVDKN